MKAFLAGIRRVHEIRFLRFALVGTGGFVVNEIVLYLCLHLAGLDKYTAWFPAFAVAVNFTWLGNRTLTFRGRAARSGIAREWFSFVVSNSLGALANYAVYFLLVRELPRPWGDPLVANIVATLVGLIFNFTVSARYVFPASRNQRTLEPEREPPAPGTPGFPLPRE